MATIKTKHKPMEAVRDAVPDLDMSRAAVATAAVGVGAAAAKVGIDRRAASLVERDRQFELRRGEPLATGLRRIARGQIDRTLEVLSPGERGLSEEAVHEARKSFKRVRALARLARTGLGPDRFARDNRALRDAGRRLSGARDAEVMVTTVRDLLADAGDGVDAERLAPLREQLELDHQAATDRLLADAGAIESVVGELRSLRRRTSRWLKGDAGSDVLEPGLRRVYRQGRRGYLAARADPSSENLHAWRKRVKDLRHAAEVLAPAEPKRMRTIAKRADQLGEMLGTDHDLAVLSALIDARPQLFAHDEDRRALHRLIDQRRARLQRQALKLAKKLYAPKPAAFARRIARDWEAQA